MDKNSLEENAMNTSAFDENVVNQLAAHYEAIIKLIGEDPNREVHYQYIP